MSIDLYMGQILGKENLVVPDTKQGFIGKRQKALQASEAKEGPKGPPALCRS